jgi:hypothetical protein
MKTSQKSPDFLLVPVSQTDVTQQQGCGSLRGW